MRIEFLALPLLVTIAVAWIFYRPLLAIAILLPAALIAGFVLVKYRRSREDRVSKVEIALHRKHRVERGDPIGLGGERDLR